jgi:uncharacterized protein YjbJ (UPF0337 family)
MNRGIETNMSKITGYKDKVSGTVKKNVGSLVGNNNLKEEGTVQGMLR